MFAALNSFQVGGRLSAGQEAFTTAGTFSWTAPVGVTSVSVVCIGGGGGGTSSQGAGLQGPNGYAGVQAQSVNGQTNSGSGGGPSGSGGSGIVMIAVKIPTY